jgi:hypothetical protein
MKIHLKFFKNDFYKREGEGGDKILKIFKTLINFLVTQIFNFSLIIIL